MQANGRHFPPRPTGPPPGDQVLRLPKGYRCAAAVCINPEGDIGVLMTDETKPGVADAIAVLRRALNMLEARLARGQA